MVAKTFISLVLMGCFALSAWAAGETPAEAAPPSEWQKPIPISLGIDYALVSDYVWRGVNLSEFAGEGREKLNHQFGVSFSLDLDRLGTVGFSWWGEWYAAQKSRRFDASGTADTNLQEADYTVNWSYEFEDIGLGLELGWIAYEFPNLSGDAYSTYEIYASASFNDGKWFGSEEPILNPYVAYYYDIDVVDAGWLEIGVSHDFALDEDVPVMKDITVTPSVILAVDNRYWDKALGTGHKSTRLGNILFGLSVAYDLGTALGVPDHYGTMSLTGYVNFSQALRHDVMNDEFYGGITLAYEW